MVSFDSTDGEFEAATQIALEAFEKHGLDVTSTTMDLLACNAGPCPLKLEEMATRISLEKNVFDVMHDVVGIYKNFNRKTGELENCFLPRFAR